MIDIYIGTFTEHVGRLSISSCGIILNLDIGNTKKHRLMAFDLDVADSMAAAIQGIKLGLASIDRSLRKSPVVIHISNGKLLEELAKPMDNHRELLRWHNMFHDVGFLIEPVHEIHITLCEKIAKKVHDSHDNIDSATQDGLIDCAGYEN